MRWERVKLKECCESISDGDHQAPPKAEIGIPFVTISNITSRNTIDFDNTKLRVPASYYEKIDGKRKASKGDILYSVVGSYGIPVLVRDDKPFVFQRHIAILRPNATCDSRYVYYAMLNRDFYMKADAVALGAAQKTISLTSLRGLEIPFPPIETQTRIADILSAYDDLIENNQKQIKLLEEAAMRLYKEWFVDFRFPGYETTKFVDGVPEGWTQGAFENLCTLSKRSLKKTNLEAGLPYIGLEHIPKKGICLNNWGKSEDVNSDKFYYEPYDVLFGKIRPYFHKVGFVYTEGICSTDTMVLRAHDNMFGLLLTTAFSEKFVSHSYATCREGAKMPRADWNEMRKYAVLIPDAMTLKSFNNIIMQCTSRMSVISMQIQNLTEARDRLLPKLMNGEIEV